MGKEAWLTDDEKDEIRQVVREQRLFGYTNEEATTICAKRLHDKYGRRDTLSRRTYEIIKIDEANRNEVTNWVTVYTKRGYLDNYRQWMEETIFVKERLLKLYNSLTNKPMEEQERLSGKINSTARSIRETIMLHTALGLGSPAILQMKNAVDKGLADEFLPERELSRIKESGKDSTEDIPRDEYSS